MDRVLPSAPAGANGHAVSAVSTTDRIDSDDKWFAKISKTLLPSNAGMVLGCITGIEERSCYRYASGTSAPTGHLVRALLRSDQGNIWLSAIMDGSTAKWWREHRICERKAALFDQARIIMAQVEQ